MIDPEKPTFESLMHILEVGEQQVKDGYSFFSESIQKKKMDQFLETMAIQFANLFNSHDE